MDGAVIEVVVRYVHVVSAVVLVGGMIFVSIAVKPALKVLGDDQRRDFLDILHKRFVRVALGCFAALFITGAYNWVKLAPVYKEMGPKGNAVIGIKVLLAAIAFLIVWTRSIGLLKLPGKVCHLINLHLAAIIILLAGLLRYWRIPPGL